MATLQELEDFKYFPPGSELGSQHRADTVVTMHVDGAAYFAAIHKVLDTLGMPGDRLYITSWNLNVTMRLRPPVPGEPILADRLIQLAAAKVDVRVIVALPRYALSPAYAPPWREDFFKFPFALALGDVPLTNIASVRTLRRTPFNGPPPLAKRVLLDWGGGFDSRHEKCTIAYSSTTGELHAFVGGLDYVPDRIASEGHAGTPHSNYWHDGGVQLQGGAAGAVLENFWTRWDETETLPERRYWYGGYAEPYNPEIEPKPAQLKPLAAPMPQGLPAGSHSDAGVRIWRSYGRARVTALRDTLEIPWKTLPPGGVKEVLTGLLRAIGVAERYIYVEDQSLNPNQPNSVNYGHHLLLYPAIKKACADGIKVIFVTQGFAPGPIMRLADATPEMSPEILRLILDDTTRPNFVLLRRKDTKVHAKIVLIDDEFISIGSANVWDRSQFGWESEVNAAVVHPGGEASLVADLRVRLWAEHLRPPPGANLRNLDVSLGYFRDAWGTGSAADLPSNALLEISP